MDCKAGVLPGMSLYSEKSSPCQGLWRSRAWAPELVAVCTWGPDVPVPHHTQTHTHSILHSSLIRDPHKHRYTHKPTQITHQRDSLTDKIPQHTLITEIHTCIHNTTWFIHHTDALVHTHTETHTQSYTVHSSQRYTHTHTT